MTYTIRRMREEDIPQVVEIEKIAFSRPWTKSIFKAALLLPYAAYYVAVEDDVSAEEAAGKVVGMCGVKRIFEEGDISNVAVHPAYRGRGISRKMLEVLMREARREGVQAHHIIPVRNDVKREYMYNENNGVTLCRRCHWLTEHRSDEEGAPC